MAAAHVGAGASAQPAAVSGPAVAPTTTQSAARPKPFLVLSDSTLQHLLWSGAKGQSYGVVPYQGSGVQTSADLSGFVISCPGATLVTEYAQGEQQTPSVLEVLAWQYTRALGEKEPYLDSFASTTTTRSPYGSPRSGKASSRPSSKITTGLPPKEMML